MNTCWEYENYDLVWIIGLLDFGMEKYGTCMKTMILVWIIGLLDFCMELFDEEETINPFFFFMNLGLKEPYLWYIGCVLDLGWLIVILN